MCLSAAFLGELISWPEIVSSCLTFIGVILISNPTFGVPHPREMPPSHIVGCVLVLLAAPLSAGETIFVRYLGNEVHFLNHVFTLGVATALCGLVMGRCTLPELESDQMSILLGSVAGLFGYCAHGLMNKGK